jgi:hypothetical protein
MNELLSQESQPVILSPEEQAVLESNTLEAITLQLFITAQQFHLTDTEKLQAIKGKAIARADTLQQELISAATSEVIDPQTQVTLAEEIVKATESGNQAQEVHEKAVHIAESNYPALRQLIVDSFNNTGGTPIPPGFAEALQSEKLQEMKPETRLLTQVAATVLSEVITCGRRSTSQFVLAPTEPIQPKVLAPKPRRIEGIPHFSSWEDVFLDYEVDRKTIQLYRSTLQAVMRNLPKRFGKYMSSKDHGKSTNYLSAIEQLYFLTVGDLNAVAKVSDSRTIQSAKRIMALIYRIDSGEFRDPDEFEQLAHKIRTVDKYDQQVCVADIIQQEFLPEYKFDSPLPYFETHPPITKEETRADIYEFPEKTPEKKDEITTFIRSALNKFYSLANQRNVSIEWPLTATRLALIDGRLTAKFVDQLAEDNVVRPAEIQEVQGGQSYMYSQLEVIKLMVIKRYNLKGKLSASRLKKYLKKFEKPFQEVWRQFQEGLLQ